MLYNTICYNNSYQKTSDQNLFLQSTKHERYYKCRSHACKRVCKDFQTTNLSKYHNLYFQIDTLLLANVLNNFQNMCL